MNEKVKTLIEKRKAELEENKQKERDKHLISLGLIDESKNERHYISYHHASAKYDREKRMHYIPGSVLDISDAEYEEICKYFPPVEKTIQIEPTSAEKTLSVIATIILVVGILGSLISLVTLAFPDEYGNTSDSFSLMGFAISISILISTLITWSFLKVFCEMAANIRQGKSK